MNAPTISCGTPRIVRPSKLVSSTTTRSGARQMRVSVSELGRFIGRATTDDIIGGWHEGDSPRRGQGHPASSAYDPHTQTDCPDLRSAVPAVSAGPAET